MQPRRATGSVLLSAGLLLLAGYVYATSHPSATWLGCGPSGVESGACGLAQALIAVTTGVVAISGSLALVVAGAAVAYVAIARDGAVPPLGTRGRTRRG